MAVDLRSHAAQDAGLYENRPKNLHGILLKVRHGCRTAMYPEFYQRQLRVQMIYGFVVTLSSSLSLSQPALPARHDLRIAPILDSRGSMGRTWYGRGWACTNSSSVCGAAGTNLESQRPGQTTKSWKTS